MIPKLFLGPMSKNVVEAIVDLNLPIGLIPSRRQVEYNRGYTGYTTEELFKKVKNTKIVLCRDHAGPGQGQQDDDGKLSLQEDVKYMDLIHIDPWKKCNSIQDAANQTVELIKYCLEINPNQRFEVGTEEAIYKYSPEELEAFMQILKTSLTNFKSIEYIVVQSGTGLDLPGRKNTRNLDKDRLEKFLKVCKKFNVKSKEHNGDYLVDNFGIATRFEMGLDAINIAPELGQLETEYYLYKIGDDIELLFDFFTICVESKKWIKWVNRKVSKRELILTTGHYIIDTKEFKDKIKKHFPEADKEIQSTLKKLITKMYIQAHGLKA